MLGGHIPELVIVLTLALVVFGPKRIPEIGASLGRGIRDFRRGVSQLEAEAVDRDAHEMVEMSPAVPEQKAS